VQNGLSRLTINIHRKAMIYLKVSISPDRRDEEALTYLLILFLSLGSK
ncbi:5708_t:CDS:1, partial [Funneliformis caledonium]